eukprot:ctg_433.g260
MPDDTRNPSGPPAARGAASQSPSPEKAGSHRSTYPSRPTRRPRTCAAGSPAVPAVGAPAPDPVATAAARSLASASPVRTRASQQPARQALPQASGTAAAEGFTHGYAARLAPRGGSNPAPLAPALNPERTTIASAEEEDRGRALPRHGRGSGAFEVRASGVIGGVCGGGVCESGAGRSHRSAGRDGAGHCCGGGAAGAAHAPERRRRNGVARTATHKGAQHQAPGGVAGEHLRQTIRGVYEAVWLSERRARRDPEILRGRAHRLADGGVVGRGGPAASTHRGSKCVSAGVGAVGRQERPTMRRPDERVLRATLERRPPAIATTTPYHAGDHGG